MRYRTLTPMNHRREQSGGTQKTNTKRLKAKLHLAKVMVLDREDVICDREHTIKKQERKIKEQKRELEDLNAKAAFVHEQHIHHKVLERATRDGTIQKWKKLYARESNNTKHYKILFDRLNSHVQRIAANGTKLTVIINSQDQQIKRLPGKTCCSCTA